MPLMSYEVDKKNTWGKYENIGEREVFDGEGILARSRPRGDK